MTSNGGLFPCCNCPEETSCEVIPQGYVQGKKAFEEVFKANGVSIYQETEDSKLSPCSYVFEGSGSLEVKLDKTKYRDDNVGISLISTYFETPPYFDIENNYLEEEGSDLAYPYTDSSSAIITHTFKFGSHTLKHKQITKYVRDAVDTNIINRSDTQYRTTIDGSLEYCDSVNTVYFIKKDKRTEIYLNNVPIQHIAGTATVISYKIEATLTGYRGKGQFITTYFSWWKPDKWWLFPENKLKYEIKEKYSKKELKEIKEVKEEGEKERQGCEYPTRCEDIFLREYKDNIYLELKNLPKLDLGGATIDLNKVPLTSYGQPYKVSSNENGIVYSITRNSTTYNYILGPVYSTISQENYFCYLKPYAPNICISLQYGKSVSLTGFRFIPASDTHARQVSDVVDWIRDFDIDLPNDIGISKTERLDNNSLDSCDYIITFTADTFDPTAENSSKSLFYINYILTTWWGTKLKGVIRIKLIGESSQGDTGRTINIWDEYPRTGVEDYCVVNKIDVSINTSSNLPGAAPEYASPITEYVKYHPTYCFLPTISIDFTMGMELFNEIHGRSITERHLLADNKYRVIPRLSSITGTYVVYETDVEENSTIYPFVYKDVFDEYTNISLVDNVNGRLKAHNIKYPKQIIISYTITGKVYYRTEGTSANSCQLTIASTTPPADIEAAFNQLSCIPEDESGTVIIDYPESSCNIINNIPSFQGGSITTQDNSRTINFHVLGKDIIAEYIDNFNGNSYHQHKIAKGSVFLMSGCSLPLESTEDNIQNSSYWRGYDTMYKVTITDIKYE